MDGPCEALSLKPLCLLGQGYCHDHLEHLLCAEPEGLGQEEAVGTGPQDVEQRGVHLGRSLWGLEEGLCSLPGRGGMLLGLKGRPCKVRERWEGLSGHKLAFAPYDSLAPDPS